MVRGLEIKKTNKRDICFTKNLLSTNHLLFIYHVIYIFLFSCQNRCMESNNYVSSKLTTKTIYMVEYVCC